MERVRVEAILTRQRHEKHRELEERVLQERNSTQYYYCYYYWYYNIIIPNIIV